MFGKTEIQAGNLKRQSKHMKGIAQWAGMGGYVSEGKRLSILIQCFLWFEKLDTRVQVQGVGTTTGHLTKISLWLIRLLRSIVSEPF